MNSAAALAGKHGQLLLAPWRQRRNEGRVWGMVAASLVLLLPALLLGALKSPSLGLLTLGATLGLLLQVLWVVQFSSLLRQNHPNHARLVPGHTRRLREAAVGLWLALVLASGLLLGGFYGAGALWALAAGLAMLVMALLLRYPLLWIPISVLPSTAGWWWRSPFWREAREALPALYAQHGLLLGMLSLLLMAWGLCLLLQDGGHGHRRAYARSLSAAAWPCCRWPTGAAACATRAPSGCWRRACSPCLIAAGWPIC